ncbi:MAG: hypothetical protein JWS11_1906 [Cypionkella sp.]|nr:hypothetical protein [Cypionkella sp.]
MGRARGGGFLLGNGLSLNRRRGRHNVPQMFSYTTGMDPMFEIPKNRKRLNVSKLCLLLGMTTLLYMTVTHEFAELTAAIAGPAP